MSENVNRFLGDTPGRVVLKLAVLSFLFGIVMSAFGWSPLNVIDFVVEGIARLWNMGFEAFERFFGHVLLGAAIVVPAFFLIRLLKYRS